MTDYDDDTELLSRQRTMLHISQETAENLIVDAALHLSLVYGGTVQGWLAGVIASVDWRPSEWDEIAANFREDLGITEVKMPRRIPR